MEIYIIIAAVIIIVVVYILFKSQNSTLYAQITKLQDDLNVSQKEAGRVGELEKNYNEQKIKNKELSEKIEEMHHLLSDVEKDKTKLSEQKEALKKIQEQQEINFSTMQKAAESRFKEIASTLLTEKTEELQNKGIEPLSKNLTYLQEKLASMEHLNENLQKEASNLANALKNNKKQGDFGEMLLEQLLESCGLKEGVHYKKQNTDKETKLRPDFIINMPGNRYLVIDCKMVLTAYTNYANEKDPVKSKQFLDEHIKALKTQIDELSKKKYQELKEVYKHTPDFVIMYVPIEAAYLCALEYQKDLGIFASGKKVMVATASSLIPILKTIEQLWNIYLAQKHTEEILKLGKTLHEKVSIFANRFHSMKGSFDAAMNHYEEARKSLEGQGGLVSQVKKLEDLGAKSGRQLPELDHEEETKEDMLLEE